MDIIDIVLNLMYPNFCIICEEVCTHNICSKCKLKIKQYEEYCIIKKKNCIFDEHAYIFKYKGIIREKIIEYKFREKPYLFKNFANLFLENERIYELINTYEIIISVPIHGKRKFERGYNQAELIAREIAKKSKKIKFEKNVLIKSKNSLPQSSLKKFQRIENVKGVFEMKNSIKIKNKKVLLVDDIFTTGSTINECSKILKQYGAERIGILTIAKD